MRKPAVAIAIAANPQDNPFAALMDSAKNFGQLAFHFMYGTPQNARITYIFAIVLSVLGIGLDHMQSAAVLQNCPVTSL